MNNLNSLHDTLITITENMALIVLTVSQWSGRKKLRADDLALTESEIPSAELVSLGSKRICNPDALRVFGTLKGQADRACLKVGTRFLGGYLIPNDRIGALCAELDAFKTEYERETQHFLTGYDREIEEWIDQHPEWERQLRTAVDPATKIGTKFSFRYRPLIIQPADGQQEALVDDVADIAETIFHEIAQIAVTLEKSVIGKDVMNQRALGTFRRIQEKLAILSFVDPRIGPILDQVEGFLRRVPASGPIKGALFQEGFGLWMLLCDEDRMARHGAGILNHEVEVGVVDAEVEIEVGDKLDVSDLFETVDVNAADEAVQTPFLGVFEEAADEEDEWIASLEAADGLEPSAGVRQVAIVAEGENMTARLEVAAVADAKTVQDFGWF